MSGAYKPIAGLSADNQGPANTVVAIILSTTSVLFSSVRYSIGRKRLLQFDSDDVAFGVSLCFGVTMSIVSNASVSAGLGRHQDALSPKQVERYFKLRWTTQFLVIVALASAKLSIVLMFRRIIPVGLAPRTLNILIPITSLYAVICTFLVGFQCQLPSPWIVNAETCSSYSYVYYVTTALNILTDILLAGWIMPTVWALQMRKSTKLLVISMFASRVAVCAVDVGRFIVLRQTLNTDDQTWFQLPYAILDQVVVHLSINHATLPRVYVFLSNLQTGLLVTRLTATDMITDPKGSKRSRNAEESIHLGGNDERDCSSRWKLRQRFDTSFSIGKMMKLVRSNCGDTTKEGSISESPLRLQPDQGFELSTTIYADNDSRSNKGETNETVANAGPVTSLPREHLSRSKSSRQPQGPGPRIYGQHMTIDVHKTVERTIQYSSSNGSAVMK